MRIVVDAYGGDHAPSEIVKGAIQAINKDKDLEIVLTGKEEVLKQLVSNVERISIINAPDVITNDDAPASAIRDKKNSSLVAALNLLKNDKEIGGLVSAGSTGAVLTGAFMIVRRIKGISRPALAPILPTVKGGNVILIDCGANVDCKSVNLAHFAVMGCAYAKAVLNIDNPKVALLSNGVEDSKGNELIRETFPILHKMNINFVGNMEARELISGDYDVVVSDGFNGNVALKASEGVAMGMMKMIKQSINEGGIRAKLGALLMKPALYKVKDRMDYSSKGGAAFLGIEKVIIKSHGSSKAPSICASILQAKQLAENNVIERIKSGLTGLEIAEND